MKIRTALPCFLTVSLALALAPALAHDVFKEPLEKRYKLKTVSCKTCHPNSKDRSIHNAFGQMFADQFKGMGMSEKYEAAEAAGEEAKKKYEAEMVAAFEKAMLVVEKRKLTVAEMLRAGLMNGTRLAKIPTAETDKEPGKDDDR